MAPFTTQKLEEPTCLSDFVEQNENVSLQDAFLIIAKLVPMIAERHEWGGIYGRITPGMVILFPDGSVKLDPMADVEEEEQDVAAQEQEGDDANSADAPVAEDKALVWTAPECRVDGGEVDSRADVYCLGVLFRYMMLGELDGDAGRMPEELEEFCHNIESENPSDRFQTVGAAARAAQELAEDASEIEEEWVEMNIPVQQRMGDKLRAFASRQWAALCLGTMLVVLVAALGIQAYHVAVEKYVREKTLSDALKKADDAFENRRYRDAAMAFEHFMRLRPEDKRLAHSMRRLIGCYRRTQDRERELRSALLFISRFPESELTAIYNARIVELTGEALTRYGGVMPVKTDRVMVVDGLVDDWAGIQPILLDQPKDAITRKAANDLVAFYCVVVNDVIYFRIDTLGDPTKSSAAFCFGVDVDPRTFTDSAEDWDWQIGFHAKVPTWIWDLRGGKTYENNKSVRLTGARFAAGKVVEASFPLAAINTPSVMSLRVYSYHMGRNIQDDEMERKVIIGCNKPMLSGIAITSPATSEDKKESAPAVK